MSEADPITDSEESGSSTHGASSPDSWTGHAAAVRAVDISGDGRWAVSAAADGELLVRRFPDGKLAARLEGPAKTVMDVRMSREGRWVASSSSAEKRVYIWDLAPDSSKEDAREPEDDKAPRVAPPVREIGVSDDGLSDLDLSADGRRLITGGLYWVRVFDVQTGAQLHAQKISGYAVAISPDGQDAAFGGWDKVVNVHRDGDWSPVTKLTGHTHHIYGLGFSGNGRFLASGGVDGAVHVWDYAADLPPVAILSGRGKRIHHVALSDDGGRVVSRDDDAVRVWNVADGENIDEFAGVKARPDISPDGRWLLTGHEDGSVRRRRLPDPPAAQLVEPLANAAPPSTRRASPPPNPAPLGAAEAAERKPPPSAEEQQAAMAVVEEVYKLSQSRTPVEQLQLVEELLKLARQSQGADQFALFTAAGNLAGEAGDARQVCLARQELERRFTVDLTEAKLDELSKIARSTRDEGVIDSLVAAAPMALAPAMRQDKWDQAAPFLDALYSACQKPAGRRYAKSVGEDRTDITRLRRTWQSVQEARTTLETNSDDAEARLAVGRWQCFIYDDWEAGLPHLAAGSDEQLKSLAEQDLAAGDDSARQMQIADAWYDAAGSAADEAKLAMQRRARHWYEKARPSVTVRLVQLKVERRLEELAKLPSMNLVPDDEGRLPMGRWVHVLGWVNGEEHTVAGKWARFREAVGVAQPHYSARFMVPLHVRGSYELEFDFTSLDGQLIVAVLPVGERACELVLAGVGGTVGGINLIDGKDATANPTKVPMNGLPKERRLQMAVRIELNGENAKILVDFEGRPFVRWEGLQTSLTQSRFTMPHPDHPGFAAGSNSRVVFHTARLRMLSGEGQLLPAVASTWVSSRPIPAAAPKDLAPRSE